MERAEFKEILEHAAGLKRQGSSEPAVYVVSESVEATLLCQAASEVIAVERLSRIELGSAHAALSTTRGEQFYFPYSQLVGLRLVPQKEKQREGSAGFR